MRKTLLFLFFLQLSVEMKIWRFMFSQYGWRWCGNQNWRAREMVFLQRCPIIMSQIRGIYTTVELRVAKHKMYTVTNKCNTWTWTIRHLKGIAMPFLFHLKKSIVEWSFFNPHSRQNRTVKNHSIHYSALYHCIVVDIRVDQWLSNLGFLEKSHWTRMNRKWTFCSTETDHRWAFSEKNTLKRYPME